MAMLNEAGEPVHLAFPFARDALTGKVACDVQDTTEHVMTQVNVVVRYPVGYRPEKPGFGIPWPIGQGVPINGDAIQAAVEEQVPNCDAPWQEYAGASSIERVLEFDVETP